MTDYSDMYHADRERQQRDRDDLNRREIASFIETASSRELELIYDVCRRSDAWLGVFEVFKLRK